ncbi:MAG TPA: DUF4202 domain-containing protein [Tepidisphaeraceae bacterium]|jgi:hypothetical protein|nr:DUF4202 domain-containing protein [Tepidisphaeraceae bacterium]
MSAEADPFRDAIEKFDAANAQDPTLIDSIPAELLYARRMTDWLNRLYPDADESLRLAARAQHIRRWMIPRSRYPMTRAGYHQWRTTLYTFHADEATQILHEVGYDEQAVARVRSLLRKEKLKADPQTQALEDVACLVFLENYFAEFALKHDEQKVIEILRRTWKKMSERGRAAALELPLQTEARRLIEKALAP